MNIKRLLLMISNVRNAVQEQGPCRIVCNALMQLLARFVE